MNRLFYNFLPLLLFLHLFAVLGLTQAQSQSIEKPAELILGISTNAYRGDLGEGYDKWTSAYHISYQFKHQKRLHGGLHIGFGSITGQTIEESFAGIATVPSPNRFFVTKFFTVNYGLQFDIIRTKHLTFYLNQGFGIMRYQPKDQFDESLQDNYQTRAANEAYSNVGVILPTYVGISYYFVNKFGFGLQGGFTNTITDYLDNVSQLGQKQGNDNILSARFQFFVPLR